MGDAGVMWVRLGVGGGEGGAQKEGASGVAVRWYAVGWICPAGSSVCGVALLHHPDGARTRSLCLPWRPACIVPRHPAPHLSPLCSRSFPSASLPGYFVVVNVWPWRGAKYGRHLRRLRIFKLEFTTATLALESGQCFRYLRFPIKVT